jgi:probable phosphoglycerate mutase
MTTAPERKIYLLRHAATALNLERPYRLQGKNIDAPLDAVGRGQAARAAAVLASKPIVAVYSSPLSRAFETAAAVARPHSLPVIPDDSLIEADLGRWEGLTWPAAQQQDPELYARFLANPGETPYPDGESLSTAGARLHQALLRLITLHPTGSLVVVSHNGTNRGCLAQLLGMPPRLAREIRQANAGINVLLPGDGVIEVETVNAGFHLET